jgi:hypothetical protein
VEEARNPLTPQMEKKGIRTGLIHVRINGRRGNFYLGQV